MDNKILKADHRFLLIFLYIFCGCLIPNWTDFLQWWTWLNVQIEIECPNWTLKNVDTSLCQSLFSYWGYLASRFIHLKHFSKQTTFSALQNCKPWVQEASTCSKFFNLHNILTIWCSVNWVQSFISIFVNWLHAAMQSTNSSASMWLQLEISKLCKFLQ